MTVKFLSQTLLSLALLTGAVQHAAGMAGFDEAVAAYGHGQHAPARAEFHRLAELGHAPSQWNLGIMLAKGEGGPRDAHMAFYWTRKSAEQRYAPAEYNLGVMYSQGIGVSEDLTQSLYWTRKAAEQGYPAAQYNLGTKYISGRGVFPDDSQAYFWLLLATTGDSNPRYSQLKSEVAARLSTTTRGQIEATARTWKPNVTYLPNAAAEPVPPEASRPPTQADKTDSGDRTGTGIRIGMRQIVTNHHVTHRCARLRVNGASDAKIVASDPNSDLSLVETEPSTDSSVSLRINRVSIGEPVVVTGYPLRGMLSGLQVTTGNLSSLSGLGGDTRFFQMTAPVQPGNSGGPLLDSSGNLIGVVVSKLDAVRVAAITGDIPQNVNFAINSNTLKSFLEAHGSDYRSAPSERSLSTTEIARQASSFTVLIECWQ